MAKNTKLNFWTLWIRLNPNKPGSTLSLMEVYAFGHEKMKSKLKSKLKLTMETIIEEDRSLYIGQRFLNNNWRVLGQ